MIETVADLIAHLEDFDDDTPVALATQRSWPFQYSIQSVEQATDGTVYIAEGVQVGYLPGPARDAIGW